MIARDPERAVYRQLAAEIREQILSGVLAPGQRLLSEKTLAQTYQVSRDTVRRSMIVLRTEGLIVVEPGRVARVREAVAMETVEIQPGSTLTIRMPTAAEVRERGLPQAVPVAVVEHAGKVTVHAGDRTTFVVSTAAP
jgi:DNA-binding FadR family transcriptional regulator